MAIRGLIQRGAQMPIVESPELSLTGHCTPRDRLYLTAGLVSPNGREIDVAFQNTTEEKTFTGMFLPA